MNNGHELRLDLAHARQRELIAAGERARMDGRAWQSREKDVPLRRARRPASTVPVSHGECGWPA